MNMKRIPVIMDVDMGVDDAAAVLLAATHPSIELLGVTTVFGNRQLERTNRNTLSFLELIKKTDIPVAKGADRPLVVALEEYKDDGEFVVHGAEGMGYAKIPPFTKQNISLSAVDFIAHTVKSRAEKVVLIPVGPLTNFAEFITKYPELKSRIERISLMGGCFGKGNITPFAEVNAYLDPHAAKIVFGSGIPITMCGLDATEQCFITADERSLLLETQNVLNIFMSEALGCYAEFYERMGYPGCVLHDSLAVVCVARPDLVKTKRAFVSVSTEGANIGQTLVDFVTESRFNADVAVHADRERFVSLFFDSVKAAVCS
ncbi:MAG: nucleoside hydrolase [Oscillospiraceae bacterium]